MSYALRTGTRSQGRFIAEDCIVESTIKTGNIETGNIETIRLVFNDGSVVSSATGIQIAELSGYFNLSDFDLINVSNIRFSDGLVLNRRTTLNEFGGISGNLSLSNFDLTNVSNLRFTDGLVLNRRTTLNEFGGISGNLSLSNFDLINVSNLRFTDGTILSSAEGIGGGGFLGDSDLDLSEFNIINVNTIQFLNNVSIIANPTESQLTLSGSIHQGVYDIETGRFPLEVSENVYLQSVSTLIFKDSSQITSGTELTQNDLSIGSFWISGSASEANQWRSLVYGDTGGFVAVSRTGTNRIMSSETGTTWVAHPAVEATTWNGIGYSNDLGLYVAVADSSNAVYQIMISPDGSNWSGRIAPEKHFWKSVAYGNQPGVFVAVGENQSTESGAPIMISTDGSNWNAITASTNIKQTFWSSVVYNQDDAQFVAVGRGMNTTNGRAMTSSDGSNWTLTELTGVDISLNFWSSVAYGDGLYVAVANSGVNKIITSPDGSTWIAITDISTIDTHNWTSIAYGNGLFVAVANSSSQSTRVMTSRDGLNWTLYSGSEANEWQSVAYTDRIFVAVSQNGTNRVMTSGTFGIEGNHISLNTIDSITGNSTERLRITNTGNVGIGTSTPGYLLDVSGDVRIQGTLIYDDFTTLSGVVSANDLRLTTLSGVVSANDLRLTTLSGVVSANDLRLTTLSGVVSANDLRLTTLSGVVSVIDVSLTTLSGVVSANDLRLTTLSGVVSANDLQLTTLSGVVSVNDLRLTTLSGQFTNLSDYVYYNAGLVPSFSTILSGSDDAGGNNILNVNSFSANSSNITTLTSSTINTLQLLANSGTTSVSDITIVLIPSNGTGLYSGIVGGIIDTNKTLNPSLTDTNLLLQPLYGGNVGIGRTTASYRLDVSGSVRATSFTPFTGQHIGLLNIPLEEIRPGLVISTADISFGTQSINDAWVQVRITNKVRDKCVVGVCSSLAPQQGSGAIHYNAIGEGQILVCGENGDIEAGDLLCSSSTPGIAMRQDDDVIRSYTIGKALLSCRFTGGDTEKLTGCVYYCG
jgi:hypothetical protein